MSEYTVEMSELNKDVNLSYNLLQVLSQPFTACKLLLLKEEDLALTILYFHCCIVSLVSLSYIRNDYHLLCYHQIRRLH